MLTVVQLNPPWAPGSQPLTWDVTPHPWTDSHISLQEGYTVTCVFWKEGAAKRSWGAWSPEGCSTERPSSSQVLCRCNHLTYFAVLMVCGHAP